MYIQLKILQMLMDSFRTLNITERQQYLQKFVNPEKFGEVLPTIAQICWCNRIATPEV